MQLTKQQLLSAGPKQKSVTISDLGDVTVRQFTAAQTVEYMRLQKAEKHADAIPHILISGMADPALSKADVGAIMEMGSEVVGILVDEILTLSKLKTAETPEEKKTDAGSSAKITDSDSSTASA